jgi:hypothetical protein
MKKKNLVSLSVALVFLGLSVTGLLIYFGQGSHVVEHTHAWFGVLFVAAAIFHILNNWSSLKGYARERRTGAYQKEFFLPLSVTALFALGIGFGLPVFDDLANAGKRLFAGPRPPRAERLSFEAVQTNPQSTGTPLTLLIQKSKEAEFPLMAVWVEDSARHFVENLFVPNQVLTPNEGGEGPPKPGPFAPAALPAWQAKATSQQPNFERATPGDPFLLSTKTTAKGRYFVVLTVKSGPTTETYEAAVDPAKADVFRLKAPGGRLLERGLVELD